VADRHQQGSHTADLVSTLVNWRGRTQHAAGHAIEGQASAGGQKQRLKPMKVSAKCRAAQCSSAIRP